MHVSKDVSYKDDNIILNYVYQVLDVNLIGMFWTVTNGKYRIINENVFNNHQDNVVTLGTATSMANIVAKGIVMKEKPTMIFHDSKFFVPITESSFIDFCDSFDENGPSPPNVVVPIFMNSQVDKRQALWMELSLMNS